MNASIRHNHRLEKNQKNIKRTILGSVIGSVLEWYDYGLYGLMAATVFDQLFFPNYGGAVGVTLSLATFAIGFLVRPIGGVIFGQLGDRIGRQKVLTLTILLMGVGTTFIGMLPTAATIGVWAPLLLVFLRILQGIGSGSEYAGAVIAVAENAPIKRRGLYSILPYAGVSFGIILSSLSVGAAEFFFGNAYLDWGWRVPFIAGFALVIVGYYIREKLEETPVFTDLKIDNHRTKHPALEVIRKAPKNIIAAMLTATAENSIGYFFQTFLVAYITNQLGMPPYISVIALTSFGVVNLFSITYAGHLSDRVGRKPVILFGAVASACFAFPVFWLLDTKNPLVIVLAIVVGSSILKGAITGAQAAWYTEMFPTESRYTGFTVGREFPTIIGGLMPTIAAILLALSGGDTWLISSLVVVIAVLPIVAIFIGPENNHVDLRDITWERSTAAYSGPTPEPSTPKAKSASLNH